MKAFRILAILLLAALVATTAAAAAPPLRVLILTGQNNHDWKATTPVLKDILERTGRFKVDVTENPSTCDAATFAKYAALVDNYNGVRWGEKTEQALLDYMRHGGGFVVIHAANNAFGDWPEFDRLIGGAWRATAGHGQYYRYRVTVVDHQHPITKGMVDFLHARDELYHRLTMQPNIHLLATAYSAPERGGTGREEPMAWTLAYGKGRVFHNALGHAAESMGDAGFATLTQRGTEWAATGKVTLPAHRGALALSGFAAAEADAQYAQQNALIEQGATSLPALFDAYAAGDPAERDGARATLLWVVQRWMGTPTGDAVAKALPAFLGPDQPQEVKALALILIGLTGDASATPQVERFLGSDDLGGAAREAMAQISGKRATLALASALRGAKGGEKARLIQQLGARRDPAAVPALLAAARDRDEAVRMEAIAALGRIESAQATPALLEIAKTGSLAVKAAALDAYLRVADALLERGETNRAEAAYIQALGLAATDSQRIAALVGLGRIGDPGSLDTVKPFLTRGSPRVRAAAAGVVGAIPGGAAARALAAAVKDAPPEVKVALLTALARRAAPESLPVVTEAAQDQEESVRLAALGALGAIGDPAAAPVVKAALAADSPRVKAAAAEAYLRLASTQFERGQTEAAAAMYDEALGAAASDQQRAAALEGIARTGATGALPRVEPLLASQGPLFDAALRAYVAIGRRLAETGRRDEAIPVLSRALDLLPLDARAQAVAGDLRRLGVATDLAAREGFVTQWWVIGPFPNPGGAAFNTAYFPEQEIDLSKEYQQDGKTVKWRPYHSDDAQGIVPFGRLFQPTDDMCAYGCTEVAVDQGQDGLFRIGSDDGVVCWLNGARIHANNATRGLTVDEDVVKAHLEPGANRILLKVLNGGGEWAGVLRITDLNGSPIKFKAPR